MPRREIDWDNPHMTAKEIDRLGAHLGVDRSPFEEEDTGSQGSFDYDGFGKAVERAYANNYDVRRSLEAARLSGKDDIPNNIGSIEDAYNAHKFMKRTHHNKIGNDERFDYDEMAGVTNYWVKKDRENFTNDMNGQMEKLLDDALGEQNTKEEEEEKGPVERSERLSTARRLKDAAFNPGELYGESDSSDYYYNNRFEANNEDAPKSNEQKDGTRNFFDQSKLSLATGMNLQNDVMNNLSNAANTVTNIYGR